MNQAIEPSNTPNISGGSERTKQLTIAGYTAGFSAFFALGAIVTSPTWPVAVCVTAVSAMVAVVCYFIVKRSNG